MSEKRRLPGTLADKILDLQFSLEIGELNEAKLGELLASYSEAINHFYELKDERFKFYQDKIKKLFANPQVKRLLGQSNPQTISRNKQEIKVENKRISKKVQEAEQKATQQAKSLIQQYECSRFKTTQRITSELSSQKQNIMQRIKARSTSKAKQEKNCLRQQQIRRRQIMQMLTRTNQ